MNIHGSCCKYIFLLKRRQHTCSKPVWSVNNPFPETRRSRLTVEPSHFIRPPYFIDHSEPPYLEKKKAGGEEKIFT